MALSVKNRIVFGLCLFTGIFLGCKAAPEAGTPTVEQQAALTFSITGLDNEGRLIINSEEWTQIDYSANAENPVITFTSAASSLTFNGTVAASNPMSVYAAKAAEGSTFSVTASLTASDSRAAQTSFSIYVVKPNIVEPPVEPPAEDTLISLSVNNVGINESGGYHPVTYTVEPASLQNTVTVRYTLNPADGAFIELFDSDDTAHPNSVRALSNTAGTYTVTANATDSKGTSKSGSFTVTVSKTITYPDSITVTTGNLTVYPGESAETIIYTIEPASLQNTALVTYSYAGTGLTIKNSDDVLEANTVKATADAAAGARTVTATAVNPEDPLVSVNCNFTVTVQSRPVEPPTEPPPTTKTSERNGQTVAQLASTFDASANTCTVTAVDNINTFSQTYLDEYIRGVDIGSIIEVENAGGKFYDNDRYRVGDVIELLSYYGINWVRIRLWNDPYTTAGKPYGGGTNDYAKALAIAKRAKKWGMKVLLDFHYSDFWTHPGQYAVPKAWKDNATTAKVDALAAQLKEYTKQVLSDMYAEGAMPDMVQVGNETVSGFCGFKESGDSRPNEKKLLAAGLAGVREISAQYNYPIKTMLHATNGMSTIKWYFGVMKTLDFDVIGLSFYPFWHGNLTSFKNGLQDLADTFKKPICILEYSAAYTSQSGSPNGSNMYESNNDGKSFIGTATDRTIQAQANVIRNLNSAVMNNTLSGGTRYGIGSFWWEPAWLPLNGTAWAFTEASEWYNMKLPGYDSGASSPGNSPKVTWANQAFFSFTGTALPSLNAFLQMMGKPARPAQ